MCNHTSTGPPHPASSPPRSPETSHCHWEVFSSRMNPGFHCTGQMADSVYGVVWVSGLLMSTLWIEWPMVAVGLWYGQAHVMDNEHRCILLMPFLMHRDTVTRSWGPFLCHSSTTITLCCTMIMHSPMLQGFVHNSWKLKTSQFLHGQNTHRTCHPLSMFGMLWIQRPRVPVPANIQQLRTAIEEEWTNIPQSTTWSTLCEGAVSHQMLSDFRTFNNRYFSTMDIFALNILLIVSLSVFHLSLACKRPPCRRSCGILNLTQTIRTDLYAIKEMFVNRCRWFS